MTEEFENNIQQILEQHRANKDKNQQRANELAKRNIEFNRKFSEIVENIIKPQMRKAASTIGGSAKITDEHSAYGGVRLSLNASSAPGHLAVSCDPYSERAVFKRATRPPGEVMAVSLEEITPELVQDEITKLAEDVYRAS